jgi:thioredoxin reductase (NADPH)
MGGAELYSTDVIIIGAGPVGLFAVFECGMLNMRCHVVDTLEAVGGQCTALYPEKPIYDIPAYPSILAGELIDKLVAQAEPFAPHYHLGQQVVQMQRVGEAWHVITSKGVQIQAKAVIIAGGCGAFGPNRPPLEGIEAYEGTSVFYLVARKADFAGKRIVIAGGGDSAIDWAIALADVAAHIYVVHRRPKFRAAPESISRLEALCKERPNMEMVIPYQLHGLQGEEGTLQVVDVATLEGEVRSLPADVLLPFFGLAMELGPIAQWGLQLDMNHIAVHPATMQTNLAGVYAVGDMAQYEGKLKLILCGFSEAAMAAHHAYGVVNDGKALHFEYSTSKGVAAA